MCRLLDGHEEHCEEEEDVWRSMALERDDGEERQEREYGVNDKECAVDDDATLWREYQYEGIETVELITHKCQWIGVKPWTALCHRRNCAQK